MKRKIDKESSLWPKKGYKGSFLSNEKVGGVTVRTYNNSGKYYDYAYYVHLDDDSVKVAIIEWKDLDAEGLETFKKALRDIGATDISIKYWIAGSTEMKLDVDTDSTAVNVRYGMRGSFYRPLTDQEKARVAKYDENIATDRAERKVAAAERKREAARERRAEAKREAALLAESNTSSKVKNLAAALALLEREGLTVITVDKKGKK